VAMSGTFWNTSIPSTNARETTVGEGSAFPLRAQGRRDQFLARVSADGRVMWAEAVGGNERVDEKPPPGVAYIEDLPEGLGELSATADGGLLLTGLAPLPMHFGRDRTTLGLKGHNYA